MDGRSDNLNHEINTVLYDEDITRELKSQFLEEVEHCTPFDLDEYKHRSTMNRFVDSVYRLASSLM